MFFRFRHGRNIAAEITIPGEPSKSAADRREGSGKGENL
jgi:hypothetical protein